MPLGMNIAQRVWIPIKDRRPTQDDGDQNGYVFAWHAFNGAVLARWNRFENRFFAYWMPVDSIALLWINTAERMPEKEDCDEQECILALCADRGLAIVNRHLIGKYAAWQRLPAPPDDYRALRRKM